MQIIVVQGVLQVMLTCPEIVVMHSGFSKLPLILAVLRELVLKIINPLEITNEVQSLDSSLEQVEILINQTNH